MTSRKPWLRAYSEALLSLQPAHLTGELTLVASRPLRDNEQPAWLTRGRLADGAPTPADLLALSKDRLRKHVLIATDTGLRLRVQANCFARGKTDLDRSEVEDLLGRLDLLEVPSPSPVKTDALVRMLTALEKRDTRTANSPGSAAERLTATGFGAASGESPSNCGTGGASPATASTKIPTTHQQRSCAAPCGVMEANRPPTFITPRTVPSVPA